MSAGFEAYNDQGQIMLSLTHNLMKEMGQLSIGWNYTGSQVSGTITDGRFTQYPNCVPFIQMLNNNFPSRNLPVISVSGNTLTWTYPHPGGNSGNFPNVTFMFGII